MKRINSFVLVIVFSFSVAIAQSGSVDFSFKTDFDFGNGHSINAVSTQTDGKIIIAGFSAVPLLKGNKSNFILRLNTNGKLDTNFIFEDGFDNVISSLLIQPDGKILVCGYFTHYNAIQCEKIARLNIDGTFDLSFSTPDFTGYVNTLALQTDNKIIISGKTDTNLFTIMRVNNNGSLDSSFKKIVVNYPVDEITMEPNGKAIISGYFSKFNNKLCPSIVRINYDGTLDTGFNPHRNLGWISEQCVILQPDGKLLVGGRMLSINNQRINIVRLNHDGSLDSTFYHGEVGDDDSYVTSMCLQKNGKILLGGSFNTFKNKKNKNIACLNMDGSLDTTFKSGDGFDNTVRSLKLQSGNKMIVVGDFDSYDSYLNSRIVRLNINDISFELTIFPNPNDGNFKINASKTLKSIIITDAVGKEVFHNEPMSSYLEIDLRDKSSGMYFIKVFSSNESKCLKVFKH